MPTAEVEREVAPALVQALLHYVRTVAGQAAFDTVTAAVSVDPRELMSQQRWFSSREAIALAEAAARVCHDPHIGARAGAELWLLMCRRNGYVDLVRSAKTIAAAVAAAAERGSKMSTGHQVRVVDVGDNCLLLRAGYRNAADAHRFYCGLAGAFYSQVPRAFGMIGDAVELQCQTQGAEHCLFRIIWRPDLQGQVPDAAALDASEMHAQRLITQLEQVHELTSQLLSAGRIDEVLAKITREAGLAVEAPRYLLAVRGSERDRLRVHQRGFRAGTEQRFAQRLLAGAVSEADGVLWVDVMSEERHFGRLAACFPRGSTFADRERRLLGAYARHAASVLGYVASLEQAATDRDTARALLDLARSIAGAETVAEVAERLCATVPGVVGADTASMWLWDVSHDELVLTAYRDVDDTAEYVGPDRLPAQQLPGVERMAANPAPVLLDVHEIQEPLLGMFTATGVSQVAVVPIAAHGSFTGVVSAGFRYPVPDEQVLFVRLAGLADQAAVALQSVRLVEQMSHHAMHDVLTGLANRTKLEMEAEQALDRAHRAGRATAFMFIDLDRFKNVNDTLGHAAGDELIRHVAGRISSMTRPHDVLARLGGDEFLLVLEDVADAATARATAERIVATLREPFTIEDRDVSISCSIGIACYPDHGRDFTTLLQNADAAMYEAKASGRDGVAVFAARPGNPASRLEVEGQPHPAIGKDALEAFDQPA